MDRETEDGSPFASSIAGEPQDAALVLQLLHHFLHHHQALVAAVSCDLIWLKTTGISPDKMETGRGH